MVPRHLGMALLVLGTQVCAGCNNDVGSPGSSTSGSDSDEPSGTSTSTGEAVTIDIPDATDTVDLTATAADPGDAPFEAICAFYGVKRALCFEDETSEAAELACRDDIHKATLADGMACHDAYADYYYCKTAGECEDLDRPSCFEDAAIVATACPHHPLPG